MRTRTGFLALILLAGCATADRGSDVPAFARFLLEAQPGADAIPLVLPASGTRIAAAPRPVLTEYDVADVTLAEVDFGLCLAFRLLPSAARALRRITAARPGERLVLLVDGKPAGARLIDAPIDDGLLLVFVEHPAGELPALVKRLKRGLTAVERAAGNPPLVKE